MNTNILNDCSELAAIKIIDNLRVKDLFELVGTSFMMKNLLDSTYMNIHKTIQNIQSNVAFRFKKEKIISKIMDEKCEIFKHLSIESNMFVKYKDDLKGLFNFQLENDEVVRSHVSQPKFNVECKAVLKSLIEELIPVNMQNGIYVAGGYFTSYVFPQLKRLPKSAKNFFDFFKNEQDIDIFILDTQKDFSDDFETRLADLFNIIKNNVSVTQFIELDESHVYGFNAKFKYKENTINIIYNENHTIEGTLHDFDLPWCKVYYDFKQNELFFDFQIIKFIFYNEYLNDEFKSFYKMQRYWIASHFSKYLIRSIKYFFKGFPILNIEQIIYFLEKSKNINPEDAFEVNQLKTLFPTIRFI